jgi:hypothetical protein
MVKAAEKGPRCDGAKTLGDAMERGVLGQGSMSSLLVVVARVGVQDPAQVYFAQDHDMVQALSLDRTDETFDVSVLPGRSWCRWSVPDAHGREASCYDVTIGGVPVANEVLRRLLPGEGLGDLAGDRVRSGVGGDVDPDQVTALEPDDDQPIEQLEAGGWHDEQNQSHQYAGRDCEGKSSSLAMAVRAVGPYTWPRSTGRPRSPA